MSAHDGNTDAALTDGEIVAYLRKIARDELELPTEQAAKLHLESPMVEGLELDSLAQVILLAQIEERYGFVFGPEDREQLQTIQTVRDLVEMIRQRAQAAAG